MEKTEVLPILRDWSNLCHNSVKFSIAGTTLQVIESKKWLGTVGEKGLCFDKRLGEHIAAACVAIRDALAQANARTIPVHLMTDMVQTKALGALLVAPFLSLSLSLSLCWTAETGSINSSTASLRRF